LGALLASSVSSAQVAPPPGAPPGQGQSPGTGGLPPIPPPGSVTPGQPPQTPPGIGNLPPLPGPGDRPSDEGYPDGTVNNTPSDDWYQDMYNQIYYTNYYYSQVEYYAYNEYANTGDYDAYNVYAYASYLRYSMQEYYWASYDQYGKPKHFPWGHYGDGDDYASRGDFDYGYYYYIRPLYLKFYEYAYKYYSKHHNWSYYDYYVDYYDSHNVKHHDKHNYMYESSRYYHKLTRCKGGHKGNDPQAKDDTVAYSTEQNAGIAVSESDVLSN
jgi:hypothetical protein